MKDFTNTEIANATVLYVASKAKDMNAQDVLTTMTDPSKWEGAKNGEEAVMAKYGALPTAALMYGAMTGYANSTYASNDFKTAMKTPPKNLGDVFTLLNKMTNDTPEKGGKGDYTGYVKANDKGVSADMDGSSAHCRSSAIARRITASSSIFPATLPSTTTRRLPCCRPS